MSARGLTVVLSLLFAEGATQEAGPGMRGAGVRPRYSTARRRAALPLESRRVLHLIPRAFIQRNEVHLLSSLSGAAFCGPQHGPERITIPSPLAPTSQQPPASPRFLGWPPMRVTPSATGDFGIAQSRVFGATRPAEATASFHQSEQPTFPAFGGSGSAASWGAGGGGAGAGMTSQFVWMEAVNSTMDEMKEQIRSGAYVRGAVLAVAAREQLRGRGTRGRIWMGAPGNVFVTVAVPMDRLPLPLTLVPLRVGTLVAAEVRRSLATLSRPPPLPPIHAAAENDDATAATVTATAGEALRMAAASSASARPPPQVTLKWPNDVLVDGRKVSGVLLEAEAPFMLVGVGINVRWCPDVPVMGPDRGRPAAALAEFGADASDAAVVALAEALAESLRAWLVRGDAASALLDEWRRWVDWGAPLRLRDGSGGGNDDGGNKGEGGGESGGEVVLPVDVEPDGRLRVRDAETGVERLLAAEYLL
ncbi:unnamed protein product [Phaeothamnion confervicola]